MATTCAPKHPSSSFGYQLSFGPIWRRVVYFLLVLVCAYCAKAETIIWQENFDRANADDDWAADFAVWEIGTPTSGPGAAFSPTKCAATILNGNYPRGANSRLQYIPTISVPSADQYPRLRFWHWFSTWGGGDKGFVEIKEVTSNTWVKISIDYENYGGAWTRALLDLKAYAGRLVQIAFHFQDDGGDTGYPSYSPTITPGWYIDEVTIVTGPITAPTPNVPVSFENGLGDWSAERGMWQVGKPSFGPGSAHNGVNCLA